MSSRRVWGLRAVFALAVAAVPLPLAQSAASASSSAASSVGAGNDISFPQCGSTYPSGQAFGIVGVNDGRTNSLNPCLGPSSSQSYAQSELYWAVSSSTGSVTQSKASLYVNTADPGNVFTTTPVPDWPTSGSTPYGTCTTTTVTTSSGPAAAGVNSPACAWEYGDQKAAQDATYLRDAAQAINAQSPPVTVPATVSAYPWWLDVELANSWKTGATGQAMNVAVLQGIVAGLLAAGAPSVGVYSTSYMWGVITGGTSASTATIGRLATWIPGASNAAAAQTVCLGPSFTAGPVDLAQYPSGGFDADLSCTQPIATRVFGQTADATAAAEFSRVFPYAGNACPSSRAAVVATTNSFQDALSSQFLAQHLTTGTLLTPTDSLSPVTATALENEGISTVYIVGGPLAVTTTVSRAIAALTAYGCNATAPSGKITVQRLYGQTAYGTAKAVAEFVGTAGTTSFPGAFAPTNPTGGTGAYNDTAGLGSGAPPSPEPTAILASGQGFQDAQAASVISYHTRLPLLLTPASTLSTTTVDAIRTLGIKQVLLVGGQLAVTNAVEADLVAQTGVYVLRVAGKDYTDTARELARFEVADSTRGLGWTPGHRIMVARGDFFTDGLAGAVLENVHNSATGLAGRARPLLLIESPAVVGTYLTQFLTVTGRAGIDGTVTTTVRALTVLGGRLAVTTSSVGAMLTDLTP